VNGAVNATLCARVDPVGARLSAVKRAVLTVNDCVPITRLLTKLGQHLHVQSSTMTSTPSLTASSSLTITPTGTISSSQVRQASTAKGFHPGPSDSGTPAASHTAP
jgi:hypothetical protein